MSNFVKCYCRHFSALVLALGLAFPLIVAAQAPKKSAAKKAATASSAKPKPAGQKAEKEQFDAAIAATSPTEKAELLVKFIADFPKSEYKTRAQESLAGARAAMAYAPRTACGWP